MRTVAVAIAGTLVLAGSVILGQQQQPSQPVFVAGPAEVVGSVSITNEPTVQAQQAGMWEVRLADPVALVIPTPEFLVSASPTPSPGRAATPLRPTRFSRSPGTVG